MLIEVITYMPMIVSFLQVGQKSGNGLMWTWAGDIANHFWYCCEKADGSVESLIVSTLLGCIQSHFTN